MKKGIVILAAALMIVSTTTWAQTALKQYQAGHTFNIGLPEYMSRSLGTNGSSSFEYKNPVKDVAGFVIVDTKGDLELVDVKFASVQEFYDEFIKDFLIEEDNRIISKPLSKKIGDINFIESDATYYDKEAKANMYYLVGIVETKKAYYKVMSYTTVENKAKFKADFQKILYSLKD